MTTTREMQSTGKMKSGMELTKQEKIYIQALVTPPTAPTTVDGI